MKYFIDFEATQFSNKIIAVGCINEEGSGFEALVNPHSKLTQFITDLTGISQEMVDNAKDANEVFEDLYDFCNDTEGAPEFYCYGNADKDFCLATLDKLATSFKAKAMLSYLYTSLIDFGPVTTSHFGLKCNIGLNKVANYYKGTNDVQKHNAFEDAAMLKYVYEQVNSHESEFDAFPECRPAKSAEIAKQAEAPTETVVKEYLVFRLKKGRAVETYYSLADAITWVIDHKMTGQNYVSENIGKKILSAARNRKKYCSLEWAIAER